MQVVVYKRSSVKRKEEKKFAEKKKALVVMRLHSVDHMVFLLPLSSRLSLSKQLSLYFFFSLVPDVVSASYRDRLSRGNSIYMKKVYFCLKYVKKHLILKAENFTFIRSKLGIFHLHRIEQTNFS